MCKIIGLLISILIISNCSKDSKFRPDIQYNNTIMPLAVNNYWIYKDLGPLINRESKIGITGYNRIIYDNEKRTVFFWNWYNMPEDEPQTVKTLVRNEAEGLFYYGQQSGSAISDISRILFIKYPVTEGDEWVYADEVTIKCISESTQLPTELGYFDCYVYQITPQSEAGYRLISRLLGINQEKGFKGTEETYLYYTPEVGYVGMRVIEDETVTLLRTLRDFYVQIPEERGSLSDYLVAP